jgi:hypothetical protein
MTMNERLANFFGKLRLVLITGMVLILILHVINYFNSRTIEGEDFITAAIALLNLIYLIFYKPDSKAPEILPPS